MKNGIDLHNIEEITDAYSKLGIKDEVADDNVGIFDKYGNYIFPDSYNSDTPNTAIIKR